MNQTTGQHSMSCCCCSNRCAFICLVLLMWCWASERGMYGHPIAMQSGTHTHTYRRNNLIFFCVRSLSYQGKRKKTRKKRPDTPACACTSALFCHHPPLTAKKTTKNITAFYAGSAYVPQSTSEATTLKSRPPATRPTLKETRHQKNQDNTAISEGNILIGPTT